MVLQMRIAVRQIVLSECGGAAFGVRCCDQTQSFETGMTLQHVPNRQAAQMNVGFTLG
jgi:hypothetical protein